MLTSLYDGLLLILQWNALLYMFIGVAIGLSGSISARTDGINSSVEHINAQRDALNKRLDAIQARYYAQFNAMDTLIAQMRSTSDFLTQQLANISNLTAQSGK